MQSQAELGMRACGRSTGVAVCLGERLVVLPFIDGYVLHEFAFEADFGGGDLTREMHRLAGWSLFNSRVFSVTAWY